jgi:hypothetical protein
MSVYLLIHEEMDRIVSNGPVQRRIMGELTASGSNSQAARGHWSRLGH